MMTDSFRRDMSEAADAFGLSLSDETLRALYLYFEMLIERNNYVNLTAITDERDVIVRHFADSLGIVRAVAPRELEGMRLIDIGTGAGLPGMVLKIVFPMLKVTLLEATGKKAVFLRDVAKELRLSNIEILQGRAEEAGHRDEYRERFDIAVARAVARLDTLSEYALCFVRVGGSFIAYKGAECEEEVRAAERAIETLGGGSAELCRYSLPGVGINRKLICVEKISPTPERYPRRTGVPAARPL